MFNYLIVYDIKLKHIKELKISLSFARERKISNPITYS